MAQNQININDFLSKLQNTDENIRVMALDECVNYGALAVKPLTELINNGALETARMAKRCLWKIVRYSSKLGEDKLRKSICTELSEVIKTARIDLKREILWMLSEISDDDFIPFITENLKDRELREDARCALQRIPTNKSLDALKAAFETATDMDFKYAIAESLRLRGVEVKGLQSKKLVPRKQTNIGKKA